MNTEILGIMRWFTFKGDEREEVLSIQLQIFKFTSLLSEKLIFEKSFQKLNYCISLQ